MKKIEEQIKIMKYGASEVIHERELIDKLKTKKKLINIVDLLGRKTNNKNNSLSFYIYDNGTVEKKITLE